MKKYILIGIIALCLIGSVYALPTYKQKQEMINLTKNMDAIDIVWWVDANISYKFFWNPNKIEYTWKTRIGDCTDRALLKKYLLSLNNVNSRLAHGYCYINNKKVKHDWLEYDFNNTRSVDLNGYCERVDFIGYGIW
jgi:hypothetical protein